MTLLLGLGAVLGLIHLGASTRLGADAAESLAVGALIYFWLVFTTGFLAGPDAAGWFGWALILLGLLSGFRTRTRGTGWFVVGMTLGAPLYLAPPFFYDALTYHIGVPSSWLANGSMAPVHHHLFTFFPPGMELLYLPMGLAGRWEGAAALNFAFFIGSLLVAFNLAKELGANDRYALLASLTLLSSWHALFSASVEAADHAVLMGVLLVLLELVRHNPPQKALMRSSIWSALALWAKYTALIPLAAAFLAWFMRRYTFEDTRTLKETAKGIVKALLLVPTLCAPWLIRNALWAGNPVFPLFSSLLPGPEWFSKADYKRWLALVHHAPGGIGELLSDLGFLLHPTGGLSPAAPVLLLLTVASLTKVWARDMRRWLFTYLLLRMVLWEWTAHQVRFALDVLAAMGALSSSLLAQKAGSPTLRKLAVFAISAVSVLGLWIGGHRMFSDWKWWRWWRGGGEAEAWRASMTINDPLPAFRWLNRRRCKALLIGEARTWGLSVPHHASSACDRQWIQQLAEEADSTEELSRMLCEDAFTHIVINWKEVRRLASPPRDVLRRWKDARAKERFLDLLSTRCESGPVLGAVGIFRLRCQRDTTVR